jgi:hypothetical protein
MQRPSIPPARALFSFLIAPEAVSAPRRRDGLRQTPAEGQGASNRWIKVGTSKKRGHASTGTRPSQWRPPIWPRTKPVTTALDRSFGGRQRRRTPRDRRPRCNVDSLRRSIDWRGLGRPAARGSSPRLPGARVCRGSRRLPARGSPAPRVASWPPPARCRRCRRGLVWQRGQGRIEHPFLRHGAAGQQDRERLLRRPAVGRVRGGADPGESGFDLFVVVQDLGEPVPGLGEGPCHGMGLSAFLVADGPRYRRDGLVDKGHDREPSDAQDSCWRLNCSAATLEHSPHPTAWCGVKGGFFQ